MAILVALLLAWSLPNITIASEDITSLIGDRQYWESFQWDKAENSTIWKLQGWENITERDESARQTFLKRRIVSMLGIDFTASEIKKDLPAQMPWILSIYSTETSAEKCEHIVSWSTSKYGKPTALDTSYEFASFGSSPESQINNVEKVYEWIVGSTRIVLSCAGFVPKVPLPDTHLLSLISFTHQTNDKSLTPLFALKCSGKITALADSSTSEFQPFTFIVDTYWGKVRSLRKAPFNHSSITADRISFIQEGEDMVLDHSVDRLTGRYFAEMRSKKTQKPQTRSSGECEKVTDIGPKF